MADAPQGILLGVLVALDQTRNEWYAVIVSRQNIQDSQLVTPIATFGYWPTEAEASVEGSKRLNAYFDRVKDAPGTIVIPFEQLQQEVVDKLVADAATDVISALVPEARPGLN